MKKQSNERYYKLYLKTVGPLWDFSSSYFKYEWTLHFPGYWYTEIALLMSNGSGMNVSYLSESCTYLSI